ncbi:MAG: cation:proton antiporter, partial [Candidatus Limnocylindria bacterium]
EPEIVLALLLPPILFSAAFFPSPRDLWRNVRPITLLAVGLVFTTTLAVATVVMAVAPQVGWPVAIALGAIVSPPDAIAATSIARRLNLPRRLVVIFEGESLVNDATALTTYRLAVAASVGTGAIDVGGAAISFVSVAVGGVIVGLIVGWVAAWLLSLLEDPPVEVLVSLLIPFAAYLPAETLGVSGVLATVAAGLLVGSRATRVMGSDTRLLGASTWKMVIFVVNGMAFLLIGLQLPTVTSDIDGYQLGDHRHGSCGIADRHSGQACVGLPGHVRPALALPIVGSTRPRSTNRSPADPWVGRHARCGIPGRGSGAAVTDRCRRPATGPWPRHLPRVQRHPRHAHRPGPHVTCAHPCVGRGR